MNVFLCQKFSVEKVKIVVFQMEYYKASNPDGYGTCFYQYH